MIIAADDFLPGRLPHRFVVQNAIAHHIDPHIRGGFIRAAAVNFGENSLQHREDFHIPVVIHGGDSVGFQMEGVDHIHIIQIRRGGFISQIDRVF